MTWSCAQFQWTHLIKIAARCSVPSQTFSDEEIEAMDWSTKVNILKRNPVLVARQIDHIFQSVWNNISCMLRGSDNILNHIEKKLNIKVGESTPDKKFYLKDEIECLAACNGGPMMQVNHKNYENLTLEKVDNILEGIK